MLVYLELPLKATAALFNVRGVLALKQDTNTHNGYLTYIFLGPIYQLCRFEDLPR